MESAQPPSPSFFERLSAWIVQKADFFQDSGWLRNSLVTTLLVDTGVLLTCCFCRVLWWQWRLRQRRHRRAQRELEDGEGERPVEERHGDDAPTTTLNVTAENYLLFLRTGRQLFIVLSMLALPVSIYVGSGEIVASTSADAARIDDGNLDFNTSATPCRAGFPNVIKWNRSPSTIMTGDMPPWERNLDINASVTLAACKRANTSVALLEAATAAVAPAVAPRECLDGEFRVLNLSFSECAAVARRCGAVALAYGNRAVAQRRDDDVADAQEECWLFSTVSNDKVVALPPKLVQLPGFYYCEGQLLGTVSGLAVEFGAALLYGIVVIGFAYKFLLQVSLRQVSRIQRHTLWLTRLPVHDHEDGARFELSEYEFRRVGEDLRRELTKWVKTRWEQEFPREALPEAEESRIIQEVYVVHAEDGDEHLAGHAFAVLSREVYVMLLLGRRRGYLPAWCHRRNHALFKFGVPPWSAVTLRCQRAPPPSDIEWGNLKVGDRWIASLVLKLFLVLFVLALAVPDVSLHVFPVIEAVRGTAFGRSLPGGFWNAVVDVVEQLPSYVLLLINAIILPLLIEIISEAQKPHLRSRSQSAQFSLNVAFLVLASVIVPLLHILVTDQSLLEQATNYVRTHLSISRGFWENIFALLEGVRKQGLRVPADLMLKYLMNAALVSNGFQLIQLSTGVGRCLSCGRFGRTPVCFAWGYWYAWSMSIMYLTLTIGVAVPAALPIAALFFLLTHAVHGANLRRNMFETFEMDQLIEGKIAVSMINSVAFFWTAIAWYFYARCKGTMDGTGSVSLSLPFLKALPGSPAVLAVGAIHDASTRMVLSGGLLALAIVSGLGSCYAASGWFERLLFRRLGGEAPDRVVTILAFLTVTLLTASMLWRPNLELHVNTQEVPLPVAFAVVLLGCSLMAWLLGVGTLFVESRRARFTSKATLDPNSFRSYTRGDLVRDLATSRTEEDLTLSGLIERRSWYMPPDRQHSTQLSSPSGSLLLQDA
eukprot:TRINITY_DN61698_c0_g1_i1.p1 TRINITY_DN61698_c0_g1~~TRINITY_DN61698_c0_g1_i1.p1  ORF type:complete len:994 (+),score=145.79 TRINITY_DN61698_c0_g1_i1:74-3055(+)